MLRRLPAVRLCAFTCLVPCLATAGYSDEIQADNPLGYWRLGEMTGTTAVDASGNGIDGVYSGGVTLNVPGLPADNTAVLVDGTDGRVILGQPASINTLGENFTIEACDPLPEN